MTVFRRRPDPGEAARATATAALRLQEPCGRASTPPASHRRVLYVPERQEGIGPFPDSGSRTARPADRVTGRTGTPRNREPARGAVAHPGTAHETHTQALLPRAAANLYGLWPRPPKSA